MNLAHQAKWYVYELADPRTNVAFYVGKGCGNRIDQHEKDAAKGVCSKKANKIRHLQSLGLEITKRKVAVFWDEQAAYDHETDVIEFYGLPSLTNIMPGGQVAFDRRLIERKARAVKPLTPLEHALLIAKDKKLMYWFTQYVIAKESGAASVDVTGNKHATMLIGAFFSLCSDLWASIRTSREQLDKLAPAFLENGLELQHGGA